MIFTILTLIDVRIKSFNKYGGALKIVLSKCIIIAKKMGFFFQPFSKTAVHWEPLQTQEI